MCTWGRINERLARARRAWLFLDYDGTLADFAPTPEHVDPDRDIIRLITKLARHRRISTAVISGRPLSQLQRVLPVPGILLAGTYGVELLTLEGERIDRMAYDTVRPLLETLKPCWEQLIAGREGFFLEDKGLALALHARFAGDEEAERVLTAAGRDAAELASSELFRVLGGHKFLEIGPTLAHKGRTVAFLLDRYCGPDALPLYLGDDDKDEEAFGTIKARHGVAILVAAEPRSTQADARLESPQAARRWLDKLPARFGEQGSLQTEYLKPTGTT